MKFRTQLTLFPLCVFIIVCIALSYILSTWSDMESLFGRAEKTSEVMEFVDEMRHLRSEFDRENDIRFLRQLAEYQKSLLVLVKSLKGYPPEQQTLINSIEMNSLSIARKMPYAVRFSEDRSMKSTVGQMILESIFVSMEIIRENSYQLNSYVALELKGKAEKQILIVTVVLVLTVVAFLVITSRVYLSLKCYLKAMNHGLTKVKNGELESPIYVESMNCNDELGQFIGEFNRISDKLVETMVSRDELQQIVDRETLGLRRLANTDPLTKVRNRRKLVEDGEVEFEQAIRYRRALSVLIIDADDFKQINDSYGHHTGDYVLVSLCRIFEEESRAADIIGRYGGEEFVILLPETGSASALLFAERIRSRVSNYPFSYQGVRVKVTISIGVATFSDELGLGPLIDRADQALYKAKHSGKNTVEHFDTSL